MHLVIPTVVDLLLTVLVKCSGERVSRLMRDVFEYSSVPVEIIHPYTTPKPALSEAGEHADKICGSTPSEPDRPKS